MKTKHVFTHFLPLPGKEKNKRLKTHQKSTSIKSVDSEQNFCDKKETLNYKFPRQIMKAKDFAHQVQPIVFVMKISLKTQIYEKKLTHF